MEQSLGQKVMAVAGGAGLVFLVLWWWHPSDRARLTDCFLAQMEAARGSGFYGDYRDDLEAVESAETVEITNEAVVGGGLGVRLDYALDGQQYATMCAR